ncbi:MAG TPA: alpha/beta hydrolase [Dehalococcoidia bacterium]|nr:alpha/beta hydrolase [Dehalococcoidia bacterium]
MPLDAQARALLDAAAALNSPPLGSLTPEQTRAAGRAGAQPAANPEPVHRIENRTIPGPAGETPVRVYTPSGDPDLPLLVYFHGGGWVIGDLDMEDVAHRSIANQVGCVIVSVDYRLAPEHPFPAAIDDCYAATVWAAEHAAELGADPTRVAVGGWSAGGNLAAVVAQLARDRGGPALQHQVLVCPVVDHYSRASELPSYSDNADGYILTQTSMIWFWDHYLGADGDTSNPLSSPLQAADLSGLPPATLLTMEFDPLRDEGAAYADRLREAGVPVTYHCYEGQIHTSYRSSTVIDAGKTVIAEVASGLRAAFAR